MKCRTGLMAKPSMKLAHGATMAIRCFLEAGRRIERGWVAAENSRNAGRWQLSGIVTGVCVQCDWAVEPAVTKSTQRSQIHVQRGDGADGESDSGYGTSGDDFAESEHIN